MKYDEFYITNLDGSSASPIQVRPTWGFAEDLETRRNLQRGIEGDLYRYRLNTQQYRYSIPLTFVDCATRLEINSYWSTQTELLLTMGNSPTYESHRVWIANRSNPLSVRSPMQFSKFSGSVRLHATNGGARGAGGPFILDDPIWGKLDQTYNILV